MINEYAKTFFEIAKEDKKLDVASEVFDAFITNFKSEIDFKKVLVSPNITKEQKKEIIKNVFSGHYDDFIYFLCVVIDNSRMESIVTIYDDFHKLLDEDNNIIHIDVYSDAKLDTADQKIITRELLRTFKGSQIILDMHIDGSLIGGLKLYHDGKQIDASVKNQLNSLKASL